MTKRRKVGLALVLLACLNYVIFAYAADDFAPALLDFPLLGMLIVPFLVVGLWLTLTGRQQAPVPR